MERKIRLLLVDDHTVLRAALRSLLNTVPDMEVVDEAGDGTEAVRKAVDLRPDVVLMDISMPEMNGLEATRQIKQSDPAAKVLLLTMHDSTEYLIRALEAGASGYLPKMAADTDLVGAIRAVDRGDAFLYPTVAKKLIHEYLNVVSGGEEVERLDPLTDREKEVLKLVVEGYTNQEVAYMLVVSVKTVETHRAHIMEKLGLRSRAELVRYALDRGMLEVEV